MHRKCSNYQISKLILSALKDSELSPSRFVEKIGYRNTARGCKKLDEWLQTGSGSDFLIEGLLQTYPELEESSRKAREMDERKLKTEAVISNEVIEKHHRESFCPFLYADSDINSPMKTGYSVIMSAMLANQIKQIFFQRNVTLEYAQTVARRHFAEHNGKLRTFGTINFYRFINLYDHYFLLDTGGEVIGEKNEVFKPIGRVFFSVS